MRIIWDHIDTSIFVDKFAIILLYFQDDRV